MFIFFWLVMISTQILLIIPNETVPYFGYAIAVESLVIILAFTIASVSNAGVIKQEYDFMDLLSKVHSS